MIKRPRRLRVTKQIRDMVHETSIDKTDLIYPMFVIDGETDDIPSMPGIKRYSLSDLPNALQEVVSSGVNAVLYFGIPKEKDALGSQAYNDNGIVQRAIRLTKELYPDLIVIAASTHPTVTAALLSMTIYVMTKRCRCLQRLQFPAQRQART